MDVFADACNAVGMAKTHAQTKAIKYGFVSMEMEDHRNNVSVHGCGAQA